MIGMGERGAMGTETGIVFNIQRFTIHDGPGVRTEVFLKGCPLSCKWCSNPESISPRREVGVYPSKCMGNDKCGSCLEVCSLGGAPLLFNPQDNKIGAIDRDICIGCMKCTDACFMHALKSWGKVMTVDEVMAEVVADKTMYEKSGSGGITISGGESTVQWEFALALLEASHAEDIHTCLESALHCTQEVLDRLLPHTDLLITDIKHMDSEAHAKWCGQGNERVLANVKHVATETDVPMVVRIPIVPGVNDTEENTRATVRFILDDCGGNVEQLQLLTYLKMGAEKYDSLGLDYPMGPDFEPEKAKERQPWIDHLVQVARDEGFAETYAGSNYWGVRGAERRKGSEETKSERK